MKRIALIALGVVVAVGGGWSALWYLGRGEVSDRLALEVERLAARGIEVAWAEKEIGGFPEGYEVTLRDVAVTAEGAGMALAVPTVVATVDAAAPDRIVVALPPEMALTLSAAGEEPRQIDIESEALLLTLGEPSAGARDVRLTAASLLGVEAADKESDAEGVRGVAVELAGLEATLAIEPPGDDAVAVLTANAERIESIVTGGGRRGEMLSPFTYTVDSAVEKALLTARFTLGQRPFEAAAADGFAGTPLRLTLQSGPSSVITATAPSDGASSLIPEDGGADGRFTFAFGTAAGVLSLGDGALDTQLSIEAAEVIAEPSDENAVFRGPIAINRVDFAYQAPTGPAEEMSPLGLRIAAAEVMPDAALWAAIDPAGALDQSPMELVLELDGTVRLMGDEAELPAEIGNLSVEHAHIRALGAVFDAEGSIEFLQPQMLPIGSVELTALNSMQAIRDLVQADLLAATSAETVMLLAANYARAGDTPEELRATLDFAETGITLNGLTLAGPVSAIRPPPEEDLIDLPN
ncbi:MAG: DUF2125 domain-containing protein, partial [Pseudomonadota bacterium]